MCVPLQTSSWMAAGICRSTLSWTDATSNQSAFALISPLTLPLRREEDKSESAMSLSVMDSGSESSSNDAYVAAAATTDPSARAATDAAGAAGPISSMQPVCEEVEPEADMYPRVAAHRCEANSKHALCNKSGLQLRSPFAAPDRPCQRLTLRGTSQLPAPWPRKPLVCQKPLCWTE